MNDEVKALIDALKIAVDEAEGWFDDDYGWSKGKKLSELEPCYALLKKYGLKTQMEIDWED